MSSLTDMSVGHARTNGEVDTTVNVHPRHVDALTRTMTGASTSLSISCANGVMRDGSADVKNRDNAGAPWAATMGDEVRAEDGNMVATLVLGDVATVDRPDVELAVPLKLPVLAADDPDAAALTVAMMEPDELKPADMVAEVETVLTALTVSVEEAICKGLEDALPA